MHGSTATVSVPGAEHAAGARLEIVRALLVKVARKLRLPGRRLRLEAALERQSFQGQRPQDLRRGHRCHGLLYRHVLLQLRLKSLPVLSQLFKTVYSSTTEPHN